MKTYLVGGALRDAWLSHQSEADADDPAQLDRLARPSDRDWVVVGATPEAMSALGYLPVGRDFPVFLHPQTHEEYALARTERKTAPGYHGFAFHAAPEVTLEEDLSRRDLSINAMAMPAEAALGPNGPDWTQLVDPHGGLRDLQDRRLRHVTEAFAEDPVRVLRLARFAAQLPGFQVAPETMALLRQMVAAGEVDHLVAERVWQEIAKGLQAPRPSRMLEVLRDCGALARLLPEVDRLWGVPQRADHHPEVDTGAHLLLVLDQAAQRRAPLAVAFACLCHDLGKGTTPPEMLPRHIGHEQRSAQLLKGLCQRWRVPSDCRELADVVAREHGNLHRCLGFGAEALLRLLERCDALRRPSRFEMVLLACECDARGRLGLEQRPYPQSERLRRALAAAQSVLPSDVLHQLPPGSAGPAIARALGVARAQAIATALPAELASEQAPDRAADHAAGAPVVPQ